MRIIALPLAALALTLGPAEHGGLPESGAEPLLAGDTTVVRVSGGAVDSAFRSLAASHNAADFARDLPTGDVSRYQLVVLSRRAAGAAELHQRWSDVVFVRSGSATLTTGGTLAGRRSMGQGEFTGTSISAGRERAVRTGDVIVIPAGLPHHWRPTGSAAFSYVLLKLRPGDPSSVGVAPR